MTSVTLTNDEILSSVEKNPLKEAFKAVVDSSEPMKDEPPEKFETRKRAQKVVIDALPDDLVDRVEKSLRYARDVAKDLGEPMPNEYATLPAEILEQLVDVQHFVSKQMRGEPVTRSEPVQQLKTLMKTPPIKFLHSIGLFRKPDLIDIVEDSEHDKYVLKEMSEVKSSEYLDRRAYLQFRNFQKGFNDFTRETRKETELKEMGFADVFDALDKMQVSVDFKRTLYVTANRPHDIQKLVRDKDFDNKTELAEMRQILKGVRLKHSVFSSTDIANLAEVYRRKR